MQKFTKDFLMNRHVLLKNFSMILKKEIRFFFSQKICAADRSKFVYCYCCSALFKAATIILYMRHAYFINTKLVHYVSLQRAVAF